MFSRTSGHWLRLRGRHMLVSLTATTAAVLSAQPANPPRLSYATYAASQPGVLYGFAVDSAGYAYLHGPRAQARSCNAGGKLQRTGPPILRRRTQIYNGQISAGPIQVVQSALGLDTVYGIGTGQGVITDTSYNLLGFTHAAQPGQTVILWGSGVGPDLSNDDRTYPLNQNNLTFRF